RKDLTIDEAIRDPMIRLVMKADGVDPNAFERMLRSRAAEQAPGPDGAGILQKGWQDIVRRLFRGARAQHPFEGVGIDPISL
ncbi:hypothetical protein EOA50_30515, partial [Mesorhizobium sp. M1A.F.Ca.IN.020.30.1.1]